MSSVSGLSPQHRAHARRILISGCELLLRHAPDVHYTEGPNRWGAIDHRLLISRGEYLRAGDCSSTTTWLLWNALHVTYRLRDDVNGTHWTSGYTGTQLRHGKPVIHEANLKIGDLVFYGHGWPGQHVALYLGGGQVFSHGSEAGPYKLPVHYRPDYMGAHRYI